MNILHSFRKILFGNAYLLLVLTTLFWGGNGVAGRLAVGEISPMVLVALRWVVVVAITLPLVGRQLVDAWPKLKGHGWLIVAMGTCGFTAFNALFYGAAHYTSAVNLTIFQGAIPVLVLIGAVLFFRNRVRPLQVLGMAVTMVGVIVVSVRGDMAVLRAMALNFGDVLMLIACLFYAGYTLGLRQRPAVPGFVFFTALAFVAFLTSLPLLAVEMASGAAQWPTLKGWLVLLYVAVLPSLVAQIFFIRGVELIGPARAGLFVNLVPVFGALLAVILLGEPFASYHAIGLVMVLGGIWLAERKT
ncbi:DMT family transporter [Microvirga alba]|uniref:DMT family transporter n=1 Tax=Microvirga alba TaxID=2791025 RepID=A0A931BP31_9HYPH|nr:DMT family transporter [Microvirga alba]MBF9234841.1 DMT family transporter [Microvirga alba]